MFIIDQQGTKSILPNMVVNSNDPSANYVSPNGNLAEVIVAFGISKHTAI